MIITQLAICSGWSPPFKSSSLLPPDRFLSPWSESRSISCDRVSPGADQVIISFGEKYKILLDHPSSFHFDPRMLQSAGISMSKCLLICSIEIMTKGMWNSHINNQRFVVIRFNDISKEKSTHYNIFSRIEYFQFYLK